MNIGQLLGGAGVVGRGMRESEEAARVARQNQLAIEEQNRVADLKKQLAGLQMPSFQPVDPMQFQQGITPGQAMPMAGQPPPPPVAAAPATTPQVSGVQTFAIPPGPEFAPRPLTQPPLAPRQTQAQIDADRLALLKFPTAALDVIQAPAAGALNMVTAAGETVINVGGRLINAITGREVAPTDVQGPRFSMTPFYDKYVREPEQALIDTTKQGEAEPKAAAPAAPAAPNKAALQYDSKVTPYDNIIQQSAVQYGIDPVVFKRLLGTESSFNPKAVSPRGEKFGLGIGQIAAVHGLTREQMLDPNTAIPFAAQLFAQQLQRSGGDYEQALQRYKGASSAKGKADMAGPIGTILSGVAPSTQAAPAAAPAAAPGAAPETLEVPQTQARNMEMAEFYLAQPESIPYEMQQINQLAQQQAALITRQRNEAAQLAQIYMRSGTNQGMEAATRLRETINQADAGLLQLQQQVQQKQTYLQGMQGLRELAGANDPRRLSGVLSQIMGAPVGIQPRPDGKYNYFVNGVKIQDGVSPAQLASMALREFSPEARAASTASAAMENELALKRKYGDSMVNAMRDIQKSIIDGEYKLAEERAKQVQGKLTIDTSKGVAYFQQGNRVFVINPDGRIEETPMGKIETPPSARPVAGLDMGR